MDYWNVDIILRQRITELSGDTATGKSFIYSIIKDYVQENKIKNGNLISKFTNTPLSISKMPDGCKTIIYIAYTIEKNINTKDMVNITVCGGKAIVM